MQDSVTVAVKLGIAFDETAANVYFLVVRIQVLPADHDFSDWKPHHVTVLTEHHLHLMTLLLN